MFIPLFLALWLGLIGPSDLPTHSHSNGTIYSPSGFTPGGEGSNPTDTIPGDGTGGQTGTNPPR